MKRPADEPKPFETIVERSLVEKECGSAAEGAISPQGTQAHVEKITWHWLLVRWDPLRDKKRMDMVPLLKKVASWAIDFALPPRCAGCGLIVDEVHSFCSDCWKGIEFLGIGGCATCGLPLQGTDIETCAACLAMPPRISRMRAAVAYDDLTRGLALRLKYGRKVATAKTMARYMSPLIPVDGEDRVLVPVPLHRTRLWHRGFNQAAIIAGEISRRTGVEHDPQLLRRIKRTPPLKGMSYLQRRRAVAGAFRVDERTSISGRTVVLVDDVLTSGSTANACARVLKRAGAARVELISWARVVRPTHLMR